MENYELQRLRSLPIESVAERLGLAVLRHRSLCPFHEDHRPSLAFNVAKNNFHCYACGAHGNTIDLAMKLLNLPFLEACRWLADEHNVILTTFKPSETKPPKPFDAEKYEKYFEHPFLNEEARHFLFAERKLDERVVRWCRLNSWHDRNGIPWLQIPYYNREGKLIGVQNRNLETPSNSKAPSNSPLKGEKAGEESLPSGKFGGGLGEVWRESSPRFRFPAFSRCRIYDLPVLKMLRPGEDLYITEGSSDCWAMLSAGRKAIAIPSATLFNKKEFKEELQAARILENGNSLHIYPDKDAAGENLHCELLAFTNDMGIKLVRHDLPDGCKDFADYWVQQSVHRTPYPPKNR